MKSKEVPKYRNFKIGSAQRNYLFISSDYHFVHRDHTAVKSYLYLLHWYCLVMYLSPSNYLPAKYQCSQRQRLHHQVSNVDWDHGVLTVFQKMSDYIHLVSWFEHDSKQRAIGFISPTLPSFDRIFLLRRGGSNNP